MIFCFLADPLVSALHPINWKICYEDSYAFFNALAVCRYAYTCGKVHIRGCMPWKVISMYINVSLQKILERLSDFYSSIDYFQWLVANLDISDWKLVTLYYSQLSISIHASYCCFKINFIFFSRWHYFKIYVNWAASFKVLIIIFSSNFPPIFQPDF